METTPTRMTTLMASQMPTRTSHWTHPSNTTLTATDSVTMPTMTTTVMESRIHWMTTEMATGTSTSMTHSPTTTTSGTTLT